MFSVRKLQAVALLGGEIQCESIVRGALNCSLAVPDGLVVRIRRSHRRGRGSIPRLGEGFSRICARFPCNSHVIRLVQEV